MLRIGPLIQVESKFKAMPDVHLAADESVAAVPLEQFRPLLTGIQSKL